MTRMLLISGICIHNFLYYTALFNNQFKGTIICLIFRKVFNLSQYMLKITDMGKIVNMLLNDLNNMDIKLNHF
jgi:hypothetical protein